MLTQDDLQAIRKVMGEEIDKRGLATEKLVEKSIKEYVGFAMDTITDAMDTFHEEYTKRFDTLELGLEKIHRGMKTLRQRVSDLEEDKSTSRLLA